MKQEYKVSFWPKAEKDVARIFLKKTETQKMDPFGGKFNPEISLIVANAFSLVYYIYSLA